MAGADDFPKETRDDYSSKNTGRDCDVGFGCAGDDVAGECPDRAGMQRQIPGGENRRHARWPEVERLPESPVRRRRNGRASGRRSRRCGSGRRAKGSRQEGIEEGSQGNCEGGCGAGCSVWPAVYPNAVDPKYSKETAGKARMHTCVDQYNANKASNGNGGLKWIQKGGGYYSECSKKLKGAA